MKYNGTDLEKHKSDYKKKKNLVYLFIGILIFAIWLILLVIKIITAINAGGSLSEIWRTIANGIFDNILGILPPIIFFDLLLEYFQQEKIFDEMTEQITGTIMSKPEVIESFDDKAKKRFLNATVLALVDQDKDECAVAMGAIEPYINDRFDIRKDFMYYLEIRDCDNIDGFSSDKYMLICESLSYELFYIASKPISDSVRIEFFVKNSELDKGLREEDAECIMQEGMEIAPEDFAIIKSKSSNPAVLHDYINSLLTPQLYIDDEMWLMSDVTVYNNKFNLRFTAPKKQKRTDSKNISNKISLYFRVPQFKSHSAFLASISQPTYSPTIRISYPENKYEVRNFLFFNKTFGPSAEKAEQGIGCRNIQIKDKWVHPMSGVVFFIDCK